MNKKSLTILVEQSAKARGEVSVPREYIIKALERIERGEENVEKYPTGLPSLRGVFEIAVKFFKAKCPNCGGKGQRFIVDRVVQGQDYGPETEGHYEMCTQCDGSGVLLPKKELIYGQ